MQAKTRRRSPGLALLTLLALMSVNAWGQWLGPDPDWKESEALPPPVFRTDRLVLVDMPPHVTLAFGVDPGSLIIGSDGVVRYVMVATSVSGSVSAMYEGIRCATGQVKSYARYSTASQWTVVSDPIWSALNGSQPSKHALALAKQGLCREGSSGSTPEEIVRRLKSAVTTR